MSLDFPVRVVYCSRCGTPCKLADVATEDAQLLKHATQPKTSGYCVDCGVTDFMRNHTHLSELMELNPGGKQMLLDLRVQQQFADLLREGKADARPEEINWQRVYEKWELPFRKARRKREKHAG